MDLLAQATSGGASTTPISTARSAKFWSTTASFRRMKQLPSSRISETSSARDNWIARSASCFAPIAWSDRRTNPVALLLWQLRFQGEIHKTCEAQRSVAFWKGGRGLGDELAGVSNSAPMFDS